jgi:hypothetical protein
VLRSTGVEPGARPGRRANCCLNRLQARERNQETSWGHQATHSVHYSAESRGCRATHSVQCQAESWVRHQATHRFSARRSTGVELEHGQATSWDCCWKPLGPAPGANQERAGGCTRRRTGSELGRELGLQGDALGSVLGESWARHAGDAPRFSARRSTRRTGRIARVIEPGPAAWKPLASSTGSETRETSWGCTRRRTRFIDTGRELGLH